MRSATTRLPGHPDQACDLVAEAIVDEYVRRDPESRVQLQVSGGRGVLFVAGDILSQADFDVSACIRQTLGAIGVMDEVEPFVSLEPVQADRVAAFRLGVERPVTVTGYATNETPEFLPASVAMARRIGRRLQASREQHPDWFWLGPDADVTVVGDSGKLQRCIISVEHGSESLKDIRERIQKDLESEAAGLTIEVNPFGPRERRGFAHASGASGRAMSAYGSLLPGTPSTIGRDCRSAEKAGAWLARRAAVQAVRQGAKAAFVQITYVPGDARPALVRARDENGKDIRSQFSTDQFVLERVMREWWRPGLSLDAARWGFAGEAGMPWE